jgi:HK97 family phage major capsid protein
MKETPPAGTLTQGNSAVIQPTVVPGIGLSPLRRLTVAQLIASGTTDSNTVRYLQEVPFSATAGMLNAAAAVAETDVKPASRIRLRQVDEPVRKIATYAPISDEMLEDVDQLRSYLDERLRLFILLEEEDQLINGNGTAPNVSGFLDRSIQTSTQDALNVDPLIAVYEAMTLIRATNNEPDGIIVHPTDWMVFRTAQDTNGQFFAGGPFVGPYGVNGIAADNLWGLPVVVTAAIPQGTLLVGAFRTQAQVFRKGGVTVEASNSHDDYFVRNMTAIRAEERVALAVYNLDAFYAITGVEGETIT